MRCIKHWLMTSLWVDSTAPNRPIAIRETTDWHLAIKPKRTSCHGARNLKPSCWWSEQAGGEEQRHRLWSQCSLKESNSDCCLELPLSRICNARGKSNQPCPSSFVRCEEADWPETKMSLVLSQQVRNLKTTHCVVSYLISDSSDVYEVIIYALSVS